MRIVGGALLALVVVAGVAWWASNDAVPRATQLASGSAERGTAEDAAASAVSRSETTLERSVDAPPADSATAAADANELALPPSDLASRIDMLVDSYLTNSPDHAGLVALWQELAERARIDPASVTAESGTIRGRFEVDLPGYDCTFMRQEPSGFSVHLMQHGGAHAADGLSTRSLTIGCQIEKGKIAQRTATVNHLLDALEPERVAFGPSGSRIIGWVMTFGDDANRAAPWYAKKIVGGRPATQRGDDRNFWLPLGAPAPLEAWNALLQPHWRP